MTGVVQEVVGKRGYSVRFHYRLKKDIFSYHMTIVVIRSELEEEIKVVEVEMITEVRQEFGCSHWFYISLHFIKEDGVDKRQEQVGMEPDPDEEDIEDVVLGDQRERHWRMVFEENNGGVGGTKSLLHDKKWCVYNSQKGVLVKCGYLVEVYDKDGKKLIQEFLGELLVEEGVEHEELGLRGFDLNLFNEEWEGFVGDYVKELPYLLIIMKLWLEYWEEQLDRMNKKVYQYNGRGGTLENGQFWNICRFSRNELWNNIGCLV